MEFPKIPFIGSLRIAGCQKKKWTMVRNVFDMDWSGVEGLDVASTMVLGQDSEEEIDARFYLLYLPQRISGLRLNI